MDERAAPDPLVAHFLADVIDDRLEASLQQFRQLHAREFGTQLGGRQRVKALLSQLKRLGFIQ